MLKETNTAAAKLIVDVDNVYVLPKRFRTTLASHVEKATEGHDVDLTGLVELQASASGMYSQKALQKIKSVVGRDKLLVVNLRKESHGFVNGMAISWYALHNYANKGLEVEEVQAIEKANMSELAAKDEIVFQYWDGKAVLKAEPVRNPKVQTVAELLEEEGCDHFRVYVTDHNRARDDQIDRFVEFVKSLKGDEWIHFHCRGGSGRATTFIVMYDMMRNAANVSLQDIYKRQHLIGGRDMNRLPSPESYKYDGAVARKQVLKQFYEYCKANHENGYAVSWSAWLADRQ